MKPTLFLSISAGFTQAAQKESSGKKADRVDKEKVVVTLLGLTETFFQPQKNNQEVLKKYNIRRPFVLYVGNAYPHKNLELLIRVFSKLSERQKDIQLVMVGKTDYFYKRLKE